MDCVKALVDSGYFFLNQFSVLIDKFEKFELKT